MEIDKLEIEAITHGWLPYSDFNFLSLFSWGGSTGNAWARLDGGLAIRLADYISGAPAYSLLCARDPMREIDHLLDLAEQSGEAASLRYVPEPIAKLAEATGMFTVVEDRNNHDYLFDFRELADYAGRRSKTRRQKANAIEANLDIRFEVAFRASTRLPDIQAFLYRWQREKEGLGKQVELEDEYLGIKRLLAASDRLETLRVFLLQYQGEIVALSIDEILPHGYVMSHFCKALPTLHGLSEYLNREVARHFLGLGAKIWNWEQDLGLSNLREMKTGYRPVSFLKKFTVRRV